MRGITDVEKANEFLRNEYIAEFNHKFTVQAAQKGTAFVRLHRQRPGLGLQCAARTDGQQDNTVVIGNRVLQLEKTRWTDTRWRGKRSLFMSIWTDACRSATARR